MKIEKIENEEFKDGVRSQKRVGRCEGEVTDALMNMEIGDCLKLTLETVDEYEKARQSVATMKYKYGTYSYSSSRKTKTIFVRKDR